MTGARVQEILVVGSGSAGLIAAIALRTLLPDLKVTIVRSPEVPPIGVGESTTPLLPRYLHQDLAIPQGPFYAAVRPSWKLGVRLDWGAPGSDYFYYPFDSPFGDNRTGTTKHDAYFHHAAGRLTSPFTQLMDQRRSTLLVRPDGTPFLEPSFAYHIENRSFILHLDEIALARGVAIVERTIVGVERRPDGGVARVRLEGGGALEADLFVDSSGFESILLGRALEEPFSDYGDALFCDSAVVGGWARTAGILAHTSADMLPAGWSWRVELADRVNRGYVFSSRFCEPDAAADELARRNPEIERSKMPKRVVRFRTGRYRNGWVGNVVAVGNAGGFVEPLEATALHMVVETVRLVIGALVDLDCRIDPKMVAVVNDRLAAKWDDIRDFLALHFKLNRKGEGPFWEACRNEIDLGEAQGALELWERCGPSRGIESFIRRESIFGYEGYLALLVGLGAPTAYRFEPDAAEQAAWARYLGFVRELAAHFVPMDEALPIVSSPAWSWGAEAGAPEPS